MTGGTLYGALTNLGSGTVILDGVDGKFLDGVSLDANMIVYAGQDLVPIRHGITLFPNRTLTLMEPGNGGGLRTLDNTTFAHAQLIFGSNGPDNGDTDLNGVVNFDDYARIDAGFNNNRSGWFNGDFDYNGVINFDDYALIDLAFNTQGAPLRTNAVPEPALAAELSAIAIISLARRRRVV